MNKTLKQFLISSVLLLSVPAHAGWLKTPVERALSQKMPHSLKLNFGLFSAVGFVGATYSYNFVSFLQVELGAGMGFSGPQLSMMPRLFFGERHRFTIGLGIALGLSKGRSSDYSLCFEGDCGNDSKHTTNTIWLNADIAGYEYQHKGGFVFSIATGFTVLIWGYESEPPRGPQVRIGVGYSF